MVNQIRCSVDSCKHNENGCECRLQSVSVGSSNLITEPSARKETECDSFECC